MSKARRIDNWPILLSRFLTERTDTPFEWGRNDCLLFAADAVLAVRGGVDPAAAYRAKYKSEAEAKKIISSLGGLAPAVTAALGVHPISNPAIASRGDVVMVQHNGTSALGIVDDSGRRVAVMTLPGVRRLPLASVLCVWGY